MAAIGRLRRVGAAARGVWGLGDARHLGEDVGHGLEVLVVDEPLGLRLLHGDELAERDEAVLARVCEAYVVAQLERNFASLDYWRSVR